MAEALGGAGLGAVVGELLTAIVNLIEKAIHFKPVLENTKRQLECLSSVIQQLDKLNRDFLDCPENIKNLREVINKGKQLILKCDAVKESRFFKYPKTPFYTKKLRYLDAELETASKRLSLQLNVQQIKILLAMGTNYANLASPETKLPLQFDHHKQLKESGKTSRMVKELGEDRYEKIFHQTFGTVAEEKLENSFACYLSTSAGPVMGVLYASTAKLAYCSDNPLSYKSEGKTEWSYYKVVIPLQQLKAVNPSTSSVLNPAEKYIQIISCDNYEFWFMGFFNYNAAVQCLQHFPELGAIIREFAVGDK